MHRLWEDYNKYISCLYMFRAHVLISRRSKFYYTASGIITPIGGRPVHRLKEDYNKFISCLYMFRAHVEAWNKLIVKQNFCATSWLITEINYYWCYIYCYSALSFVFVAIFQSFLVTAFILSHNTAIDNRLAGSFFHLQTSDGRLTTHPHPSSVTEPIIKQVSP